MDRKPKLDTVDARSEGQPLTLLITTIGELHCFIKTCSHAQTYEAFSSKYRCTVWIPLPCKQWKCRFCAQQKINHLARKCEIAKPNRLLTLTIDPDQWENPRHAFDGTRRQVPELMRQLRKRFGEIEYMRVTELTAKGWPHYHMLVRSGYLPQPIVKDIWQQLTKATIVDLRKVEDRFKTFYYLVKYLSKMHDLEWTNRHVSYSRNFFPEDEEPKEDTLQLQEGKILEAHPANYLFHQFRKCNLVELAYNVFALNPSEETLQASTAVNPWIKESEEIAQCSKKETQNESSNYFQRQLDL